MGQYEPPAKNVAVMWGAPRSNSLGVAGVIVSTVGLFTFGLLSPIGLLLSFLGLFRSPRGAALAGVIIGLFGSLLLLVIFYLGTIFVSMLGGSLGPIRQTLAQLAGAAEVTRYYTEQEKLPDDATGNQLIQQFQPLAGLSLRYAKLDDRQFELRWPGPDGQWQSPDDVVTAYDIDDLRQQFQHIQQPLVPVPAEAVEERVDEEPPDETLDHDLEVHSPELNGESTEVEPLDATPTEPMGSDTSGRIEAHE